MLHLSGSQRFRFLSPIVSRSSAFPAAPLFLAALNFI
jgi:hypothetical protein